MIPAIPCPFEITMSVFVHHFSTTDLKVLHKGKYHYYHFTDQKSRHREVNCHWTVPHLLFDHQIIHLWRRSNFSVSFLHRSLSPAHPRRIQRLVQRFKFMWSYWHCVLLFVSLWFLEILVYLPASERAEIISFSMSTDYKTRSGSCIFQTLKEPDCENSAKTVCRIKDHYNIQYFWLKFALQHCSWLHRLKCLCLFILESPWPISAQECSWLCLKFRRSLFLTVACAWTFTPSINCGEGKKWIFAFEW